MYIINTKKGLGNFTTKSVQNGRKTVVLKALIVCRTWSPIHVLVTNHGKRNIVTTINFRVYFLSSYNRGGFCFHLWAPM